MLVPSLELSKIILFYCLGHNFKSTPLRIPPLEMEEGSAKMKLEAKRTELLVA
jgi:hypothetical protein